MYHKVKFGKETYSIKFNPAGSTPPLGAIAVSWNCRGRKFNSGGALFVPASGQCFNNARDFERGENFGGETAEAIVEAWNMHCAANDSE